jgi:hypothetical protein
MTKITDLPELTDLAAGDWLPVVDVSDLSVAATGRNKKVSRTTLVAAIGGALSSRGMNSIALPPTPVGVAGSPILTPHPDGSWSYSTPATADSAARLATVVSNADFTATVFLRVDMDAANFNHWGLYARGSGGMRTYGPRHTRILQVTNWNTSYVWLSDQFASAAWNAWPLMWLRIRRVGGTLFFEVSSNGLVWVTQTSQALAGGIVDVTELGLATLWRGRGDILGFALT